MYLRLNSMIKYTVASLLFTVSMQISAIELGPVQIHGFLNQGYIYSNGNEYIKDSDNGGSFDFTNAGINFLYRPTNKLILASQLVSRNFGDANCNEKNLSLDYLFASYNLISSFENEFTINAGRIKTTYGIFNNNRNIPFTHVGIFSDQTLYSEYDRYLTLYGDGISLDYTRKTDIGNFRILYQNAKLADNEEDYFSTAPELLDYVTGFEGVTGQVIQAIYEQPSLGLEISVSHSQAKIKTIDLTGIPAPLVGIINRSWNQLARNNLISAKYNNENYTITAEYMNRAITHYYNDYIPALTTNISSKSVAKTDSYYIQGAYRFTYDVEGFISYHYAKEEVDGNFDYDSPFNKYRKQWVIGADWDIYENTLLKAEYHFIDGNFDILKEPGINQDGVDRKWNMLVMQISYKF